MIREEYQNRHLRPVFDSSDLMGDIFTDFSVPSAKWNGQNPGNCEAL